MGFLPCNSFSISHLSRLSPIPSPHAQSSPPPLPKDLMDTDVSSGGSGSEEEEEDESAEGLERILLSLCSSSDDEMEATPFALGDAGDGWAWDDGGFLELRDLGDGELEGEGVDEEEEGGAWDDGGFLELRDLGNGELEGEGVDEEEEGELGDGEVVDGDGALDDFGVLELELMELMAVDDTLVGLEEGVRG